MLDKIPPHDPPPLDFIEKLSCILGKHYIYKVRGKIYYNRWTGKHQTKKEAQDWLLKKFSEYVNDD